MPQRQVASLCSIQNFAGSFAPVVTGYIVEGTGSCVNALLAAAGAAALTAITYLVLVRTPLEGAERLALKEKVA